MKIGAFDISKYVIYINNNSKKTSFFIKSCQNKSPKSGFFSYKILRINCPLRNQEYLYFDIT